MIENIPLLEGETFDLNQRSDSKTIEFSDAEINEKYRKGEMRIITEQGRINLNSIVHELDTIKKGSKKYVLNPEYQRRKRWNEQQKSLLVESFIMNVPVPPIFLYETEYAVYEVMDGLQRLTTMYDFYKGSFALQGLAHWKELNGRRYNELPENVQAGIDRRYLTSIILLTETAKGPEDAAALKKLVFKRLNSGGDDLNSQEIRNALHDGKFNKLCLELSTNKEFRELWYIPEEKLSENKLYKKMLDVELVLRFFAHRHFDKFSSPMDKFLDKYLIRANEYTDETIIELKSLFIKTIKIINEIFGSDAFLLPPKIKQYRSPSKTVYDAMMQAFALNTEYFDSFVKHKKDIVDNIYKDKELCNKDGTYIFDGRYNTKKGIRERINYYHDFLQNYMT